MVERQIEAADFVLMSTESYHRRVGRDEAPGQELGVVWEARIIRQLLYDAGAVSDRFIPVLFSGSASAHIPTPVKGGTWYVVGTEDGYESLYRRLTKQPDVVRPVLGKLHPLPSRQPKWTEAIAGETAPPPAMAGNTAIASGDRSISVSLPPADSIDIRAELAALRDLLANLDTHDRQKIANALAEAESDAAKPEADKDEIGGALEGALRHAGKAGFAEAAGGIAPHVQNAVAWLGTTGAGCCRWSASQHRGRGDGRAQCHHR